MYVCATPTLPAQFHCFEHILHMIAADVACHRQPPNGSNTRRSSSCLPLCNRLCHSSCWCCCCWLLTVGATARVACNCYIFYTTKPSLVKSSRKKNSTTTVATCRARHAQRYYYRQPKRSRALMKLFFRHLVGCVSNTHPYTDVCTCDCACV